MSSWQKRKTAGSQRWELASDILIPAFETYGGDGRISDVSSSGTLSPTKTCVGWADI